jgi:hypothetical protein
LTADYFSIPEEEIKHLQSVLTVVGGEVVYANRDFDNLAPAPLPLALDWAPTAHYGGYYNPMKRMTSHKQHRGCTHSAQHKPSSARLGEAIWGLGCDCFAF